MGSLPRQLRPIRTRAPPAAAHDRSGSVRTDSVPSSAVSQAPPPPLTASHSAPTSPSKPQRAAGARASHTRTHSAYDAAAALRSSISALRGGAGYRYPSRDCSCEPLSEPESALAGEASAEALRDVSEEFDVVLFMGDLNYRCVIVQM